MFSPLLETHRRITVRAQRLALRSEMQHPDCKWSKNFLPTPPISPMYPTAPRPHTGAGSLSSEEGTGDDQRPPLGLAIPQTADSQPAAARAAEPASAVPRRRPTPPGCYTDTTTATAASFAPAPHDRRRLPSPAPRPTSPYRALPCHSAPPPGPVCGSPPDGAPLASGPTQPTAAIG